MADKLAYTVEEASRALGVSERTFRNLVAREQVRAVRIGRRVLIPADTFRELLGTPRSAAVGEKEKPVRGTHRTAAGNGPQMSGARRDK